MKKIFITRRIDNAAVEFLRRNFEVDINLEERQLSKNELIERAKECSGLLCLLSDEIDNEVMDKCNKLEIIANLAVGYNNIDVLGAKQRNIIVTNTPDVLTDATAELAWALLFAAARRVNEAEKYLREGNFKMWSPTLFLGQDIKGKTLGVIGAGRIGKAFVKKSRGFDMKVLYHNRKRDLNFEEETGAVYVELDELLKEADFVSIHVPLNSDTYHLIGKRELSLMKDSAVLINTSRGPVINEKELALALKEGKIWSAGLDVFEREPEIEEELLKMSNVVLLPHIGSGTIDTRRNMAMLAVKNIDEVLNGRKAVTEVN